MTPQKIWSEMEKELAEAVTSVAKDTVRVLIPGWEPVDYEMGKRWARSQVYEGYYVRFRRIGADIQFKTWEYGESEPDFK